MSTLLTPVRSAAQAARVDHPTGTTAAAVVVLLWIASSLGLDLPADVAVAIVGLATVVVSWLTPRFASADVLTDNDPPHGGTGPDPSDSGEGTA